MRQLVLGWVLALRPGDGAIELAWEVPQECPSADAVLMQIEAERSRRGIATSGVRVQARAVVERLAADELALELAVTSASGTTTRTLTASSCSVLADATVFAVLMAAEAEPPTVPVAPTPTVVAAPERALPDRAPVPARRSWPRGWLGVAAVVEAGALPRFGGGVLARAAVRWRIAELGVRALVLPEREVAVGHGRAYFALFAASVDGCVVMSARRIELPLCAIVELGAQRGRTTGLREPSAAVRPWLALAAHAELRVSVWRWLELTAGFEPVAQLRTPGFLVDGERVHRATRWGARALVGLAARLGGRPRRGPR